MSVIERTLSEQINAQAAYLREMRHHFAEQMGREPTWQELSALLAIQHRGAIGEREKLIADLRGLADRLAGIGADQAAEEVAELSIAYGGQ